MATTPRFISCMVVVLQAFIAMGLIVPQSAVAQACLAEYTVGWDAGAEVREGSPITFTFTPTAQAGLDGCGANQILVNFSIDILPGSEAQVGDFDNTGTGFTWNAGDGALTPKQLVTTPNDDQILEVSESVSFEARVSASVTATGNTIPSGTSGNNTFSTTILDPNKAPVITVGVAPDVTEDDGPVALGQAATITDENEDDQTVSVVVMGGTVTAGTDGITFGGAGNGTASFSMSGSLVDVNAALGAATFTPAADVSGTASASISFTSSDGLVDSAPSVMSIDIAHVADTPSITDATTLEDNLNTSGLVVSRAAVDGDEITHFRVGSITNGSLFLGDGVTPVADGAFVTAAQGGTGLRFLPSEDSVLPGSFTVEASLSDSDADVGGDAVTATITVTPVNDAPSFTKGANIVVNEDSGDHTTDAWATNISVGPADEAGQTPSFNVSVPSAEQALFSEQPTISATTGTLTFTPAQDANGQATVTVSLSDDGGVDNEGQDTSPDQTFTITIEAVNDAPVVTVPPAQGTLEDQAVIFSTAAGTAISVADLDAEETPGAELEVTLTAGSSVTLATTAGLTFSDGDGTDDEAVTFRGTLAAINAALDGLRYDPTPNANGAASLAVGVSDLGNTGQGGALGASASIDIAITPVNDAPSFSKGADVTVSEDSGAHVAPGWATGISAGPPDEAGQMLTFNVTVPGPEEALFAALPSVDPATGDLSFTPAENANGQATVTVSLSDNGSTANGGVDTSADQTFTITLTAVNDAPVVQLPPSQSVDEDGALTLSAATGNAVTVVDVDVSETPGAEMEVALTATSTVTLGAVNGLVFSEGDGQDDTSMTFRGVLADVNAALDGMIYRPASDQRGTGSIEITARDLGNTGAGGALETTETLQIQIDDVNDPPTFEPGPDITVAEDSGPHTFAAWATDISPGPPNESDQNVTFIITIDNDALFDELPAIDSASGDLTFSLRQDANGQATLTVRLVDDGGTENGGQDTSAPQQLVLTVTPVNDAPVISGAGTDAQVTDEDVVLVFSEATGNPILITDVDAGSGDLEMTLAATSMVSLPEGHGLNVVSGESGSSTLTARGTQFALTAALDGLTYTPEPFFNGEGSLAIEVSDRGNTGAAGEATVLTANVVIPITIQSVNNAPVANDDFFTSFSGAARVLDVLANDTDIEGDALTIVSVEDPSGGTATVLPGGSGSGSGVAGGGAAERILYTANEDFSGTDVFTYVIEDAFGAPASGTITVEVAGPGVDGDGVDDDVEAGAPNAGDGNGDGVPDAEQEHVASLPVAAGPGAGAYITLSVPSGGQLARVESTENPAPSTFPPSLGAPAGFLAYEVPGLEAGQSTVVTIHLPDGVTATDYMKYGPTPDNPDPHWYSFAWDGTTGARFEGSLIRLHLTDGLRGDDDLTANGTIVDPGAPVLTQNALPVAPDISEAMDEDTVLTIDLLAGVTDADGDDVSLVDVVMESSTPQGPITADSHDMSTAGGALTFAPTADFFGEVILTYSVTDGSGAVVQARIDVAVQPVQDAPVAVNDTLRTEMNTSVTGNLFANDFDVDGDSFFLAQIDSAPVGTITFQTGGTVTYVPPTDFFGTLDVGYSITDGPANSGLVRSAIVHIVVEGVPTAPVGVADAFVVTEDVPAELDVLANDTDINLDSLQVLSFTEPANGTLQRTGSGSLLYTPETDFFGEDAFTYIPTDGALHGAPTAVSITVLPVNDAPVFGNNSEVVLSAPGPVLLIPGREIEFGFAPAADVDNEPGEIAHVWQLASTDSFAAIFFESAPVLDDDRVTMPADTLVAVLEANNVVLLPGQRITLHHRMVARDPDGATGTGAGSEVVFERATSVSATGAPGSELPSEIYLDGNFPNPFSGQTTIRFGLPETSEVTVDVHDVSGRRVTRALTGTLPAGHHDYRLSLGARLSGGVYLYRIHIRTASPGNTESRTLTGVMQLVR